MKPDAQLEEELEFKKPTVGLGRISAQMAKQVIFQKVREAERESVYAEYHKHVGEVVNCVVKRFENGDIIVELGKTEGKLPKREQSRLENFSVSDRIRVIIIKVEKTSKGPAGHRFAHRSHIGSTPVPNGSSRDLRRHRASRHRTGGR